jgi:1-acyl-sn-glycerol-3-phosphate acyltransferase
LFRKKAIDEWALDYWLLQQYAKFCFKRYYQKIEIVNLNRIPRNQPVILAPNHQNALMDALMLVCNTSFQSVFLARADIFKGKLLIRFLTFMNIMPIYRMRDGIVNVKKNDEVFDKTLQVLHNAYNPLGIFPEGNHGDRHRLRPLVKGIFRIALQAQEKYGTQPGVKIMPIGFDYRHYQHFRTRVFVNVGEPIEVSDYFAAYQENPVTAINELKDALAAALSKLMIDIQTEEHYNLYMDLREIYNDEMRLKLGIYEKTLAAGFKADKVMIDCLNRELEAHPDHIRRLDEKVRDYQKDLKRAGLRDWVLKKDRYSYSGLFAGALLKVILFPVFAFGLVNNLVPFWFTGSRTKNIKDPQFLSSFKFVIGLVVFPIWYLIIGGILGMLSVPFWWIVLYILLLPAAGVAAFNYYISIRKFRGRFSYTWKRNHPEIKTLKELRREILSMVHDIVSSK